MATNGWEEYQRLVLDRLADLRKAQDEANRRLGKIEIEIALLKLKSGLWGFAAGALPAGFWLVYSIFK